MVHVASPEISPIEDACNAHLSILNVYRGEGSTAEYLAINPSGRYRSIFFALRISIIDIKIIW
jgi:hypothetical protein